MAIIVSDCFRVSALTDRGNSEEKKTGMLATAASSIFAFMPPPAFVSNQDIITAASEKPLGSTLSDKALALQKSWLFGNAIPHLE